MEIFTASNIFCKVNGNKMKLTKNFSTIEFACRDANGTPVPEKYMFNLQSLANNLQVLRDEIGEAIHVNSGYRTPAHNKKIGGAKHSMHLKAAAADITTKNNTPKQLKAVIERLIKEGKMENGGIGLYSGFIHYDIGKIRRW